MLLCHPTFVNERDQLRREWRSLAPEIRPQLPLQVSSLVLQTELTPETAIRIAEFRHRLVEFFERWQLNQMVSWDLPDPVVYHAPDRRQWPDDWPQSRHSLTISALIRLGKGDRRLPDWLARDNIAWRVERGLEDVDQKPMQFQHLALLRFFELAVDSRVKATKPGRLSQTDRHATLGKLLDDKSGDHVRRVLRVQNQLLKRPIIAG